jgi:putative metal-binding protein
VDVATVKPLRWCAALLVAIAATALLAASPVAAASGAADGALVSYTAFDHSTHLLRQLNGKYTAVLMTDADLAAYTTARARSLIDIYDLLYSHYTEMIGAEPGGDGLLLVAFVKTCGGGCGLLGSKGIEIDPSGLDASVPVGTDGAATYVVHEMGHNFDLYSGYIMYGKDAGHAWTDFISTYVKYYDLEGFDGSSPAESLQAGIDENYTPYVQFPGRTWKKCVLQNACDPADLMAQHAQAGVALRLAQEYGPKSVKKAIGHLREAVAARALDPTKMTIRQKNDLLIESFSYGAGANLACFFDAIAWPVSAGLRAQLGAQFGDNPLCLDADHDGWTPFEGDCDDANPAVHPGATEVANGSDDDCNGLIDDVVIDEPGDFANSSSNAFPIGIPSHVRGTISSVSDSDSFDVVLAAPTSVEFTLTSRGAFSGWLFLYQQGTSNWRSFVHVNAGESVVLRDDLGAGRWDLAVAYNTVSNPGAYELSVDRVKKWLSDFDPPGARAKSAGSFLLIAPPVPPRARSRNVRSVRFWVSRVGFVGTAPASTTTTTSMSWAPPAGLDPTTLQYRVEFVNGTIPMTPVSSPASLVPR